MSPYPPRTQRGAALLVAMVMIFMLSIMGVSVMRSSSLEKRMATNAVQASATLQAAESVTEQMLNDSVVLQQAASNILDIVPVTTTAVRDDVTVETTAEIVYIGDGPAFGFSSDFMTLRLIAQGDSQLPAARTRSIIRQGAARVVPALQ